MLLNVRSLTKMLLCSVLLANIFFALLGQNQSLIHSIKQEEEAKTDVSAPVAVPVLTQKQAQNANVEAISEFRKFESKLRKYKIEKFLQKMRFAIVLLPLLGWLAFVYKGVFSDSSDIKNGSLK